MEKTLLLIGAGGHGKVVANIAEKCGYRQIAFLDGDERKTNCGPYPVLGSPELVDQLPGDVLVTIGNAKIRKKFQETIADERLATLIHPHTAIADDVEIGAGTVVMAGAVINSGTKIGRGCIINTSSSVDHDCDISDYVHISVGAHVAGTVKIGNSTWIGAESVIKNNLEITENCMIGAGAVVVQTINDPGTFLGVPARKRERA